MEDVYAQFIAGLEQREISLGYCGLRLVGPDELDSMQIGYATSQSGQSLCSGTPGAWREGWVVIGQETGLGDPIFLDQESGSINTAGHGEGIWQPVKIASSRNTPRRARSDGNSLPANEPGEC